MTLQAKVNAVESLFLQLDQEIFEVQKETGLACKAGCGKCCTYSEIDASPLEFLPWAHHLFLNGAAEQELKSFETEETPTCHNYRPIGLLENGSGSCSNYPYRGLICRLFCYGATTDKYGKLRLATCKFIRENLPNAIEKTNELIEAKGNIPIFTHYYMQLSQIDHDLGNVIVPVNQALKRALEEVLRYYYYHPIPQSPSVVA